MIKCGYEGDSICSWRKDLHVRPKFIYFIGMSLTGLVLAIYGLKTGLYLVMIPILVFAYGIFVILRRRIVLAIPS